MIKILGRLLVSRNKLTCVVQGEQRRLFNVRSDVHFQASKDKGPLGGNNSNIGGKNSKINKGSSFFVGGSNKSYTGGNQSNKNVGNTSKTSAPNNSFFGDRMSNKYRGGRKIWSKVSATDVHSTGVQHDKRNCCYTLDLGNNQVARIDYRVCGPSCIELFETFVPEELRGRGIAKVLARGVLDQAFSNKLKVKLTCTYLLDYFNKFADPKHKNLVLK